MIVALLALASVSALAADPTGSITVKPSSTVNLTGKALKAYKILDATYSGTGNDINIAYTIPAGMADFYDDYFGDEESNKTATELAAAAGKTLDQYVAEQIAGLTTADKMQAFVTAALEAANATESGVSAITGTADGSNVKFSSLAAGYYVIEDEGDATPISSLMLDTVTNANVDITIKANQPTPDKQIVTAGELTNTKANEAGVGRAVNYKVTEHVPNYAGYDYYYYILRDNLSNGLTFNPDSVHVIVGGTEINKKAANADLTESDGRGYFLYTDETTTGDDTFLIAFEDIMKFDVGAEIVVTYSATVNSSAITGVNPNTNEIKVEYSNNPSKSEKGDKDDDHPGIPKDDDNHPTGTGPSSWTDTYTTKITIVKQDGDTKEKLENVEFTLTGTSKDVVVKSEEVFEVDSTGEYWLLKNGKYTTEAPEEQFTLTETDGNSGWVEIVTDDTYAGADIRVINGKKYRPYVIATDGGKTKYVITEPNSDDYASLSIKYNKVVKESTNASAVDSYTVSRVGKTGSNGELTFAQLGAGTYTLSETTVLPGYNDIPDITFTIGSTLPTTGKGANDKFIGEETITWTTPEGSPVTYDATNGVFTITIENNKGVELPSTGGIGTTIFYVGGSILVLAAVILLVTKRRMSAND